MYLTSWALPRSVTVAAKDPHCFLHSLYSARVLVSLRIKEMQRVAYAYMYMNHLDVSWWHTTAIPGLSLALREAIIVNSLRDTQSHMQNLMCGFRQDICGEVCGWVCILIAGGCLVVCRGIFILWLWWSGETRYIPVPAPYVYLPAIPAPTVYAILDHSWVSSVDLFTCTSCAATLYCMHLLPGQHNWRVNSLTSEYRCLGYWGNTCIVYM